MSDTVQPKNAGAAVVLYHLERDVGRLDKGQAEIRSDLGALRGEVNTIRVDVAAMGAKLSVYVSLAALLGGGLVSVLTHFLTR